MLRRLLGVFAGSSACLPCPVMSVRCTCKTRRSRSRSPRGGQTSVSFARVKSLHVLPTQALELHDPERRQQVQTRYVSVGLEAPTLHRVPHGVGVSREEYPC